MDGQDYTNLLVLIDNLKYDLERLEKAIKTTVVVQVVKGE